MLRQAFTRPLRELDKLLNGITMYRLLLYGLGLLVAIAAAFAYGGVLSISGSGLLLSTGLLLAVCYGTNKLLAYVFGGFSNSESSLITALILALILQPPRTTQQAIGIVVAGVVAMASKYLLAAYRKHLFNPAAFGALAVGLIGFRHASWWVGSPSMFIFVLVLGLLVVRKIRRFEMVLTFTVAALAMLLLVGALQHQDLTQVWHDGFLSWPLVFFGTIMLTEPATTPPTRYYRNLYGLGVGLLFASQLHVGSIGTSPELCLIIGNIFAWLVSPKYQLRLRLKRVRQLTPQVYDYAFKPVGGPGGGFTFEAGQYLQWTMPHHHVDGRGNRRTFTIASSPTEDEIHIGVKFYEPSSSFKRTLRGLKPGASIMAGQQAGDFTLPADRSKPLVFIAGGIGVTPFRSMLKYLADSGQQRQVTMLYLISSPEEIAYDEDLQAIGDKLKKFKRVQVLGPGAPSPGRDKWQGYTGLLTPEIVSQEVEKATGCTFYISGPNAMVESYRVMLRGMGVPRKQIKTDYFAGY